VQPGRLRTRARYPLGRGGLVEHLVLRSDGAFAFTFRRVLDVDDQRYEYSVRRHDSRGRRVLDKSPEPITGLRLVRGGVAWNSDDKPRRASLR
jgi:hypothetical protein